MLYVDGASKGLKALFPRSGREMAELCSFDAVEKRRWVRWGENVPARVWCTRLVSSLFRFPVIALRGLEGSISLPFTCIRDF